MRGEMGMEERNQQKRNGNQPEVMPFAQPWGAGWSEPLEPEQGDAADGVEPKVAGSAPEAGRDWAASLESEQGDAAGGVEPEIAGSVPEAGRDCAASLEGGDVDWAPSFNGMPLQEPPLKTPVGVKIFIAVLIALAVCFLGGFFAFGTYVTLHQTPVARENQTEVTSEWQVEPVDATDPEFAGVTLQRAQGDALTAQQAYEKAVVSMVGILAETQNSESGSKQGSGVIATENGYVITNAHVLDYDRMAAVTVVTSDQRRYAGVVVGLDRDADLAVVKVDAQGLIPAEFGDATALAVGESVMAIGSPGGVRFGGSMTMGVVSALNRSVADYSSTGVTYIQTDTAINPGNSGGGLVNLHGQVVGINTIKVVASGYEGMGFSIPMSQAGQIVDTLIRQGSIAAVGRLGITGMTQYLQQEGETYAVAAGVQVVEVDSTSPLKESQLQAGDRIVALNGAEIRTLEDVYAQLRVHRVGQHVTLRVQRGTGSEQEEFTVETVILQRTS